MSTTTTYMCMSVRGAIRNIERQRGKYTGLQHPDGRSMNKAEAVDALMDELAQGHEVIPMNPKCGKPCKNSHLCKGFEFGAEMGGCPGHPSAIVIGVDPGVESGDMTGEMVITRGEIDAYFNRLKGTEQKKHWSAGVAWRDGRWDPMSNAPMDSSDVRGRTESGEILESIHYARGGGDEMPPFDGWFIDVGTDGHRYFQQVRPVEWQPMTAKPK